MQPLQGEPSRIDQAAAVDPKNQKENGDAELEEEKDGKKPGKPGRGRGNNKGRGRGKGGGRGRGKGKTKGKGNANAAAAGGKIKAAGGKGKARGGRGKAAGGRGKAAGRGLGKVKSVPQNPPSTPSPSKKAKMDVDGHDAETPEKTSPAKATSKKKPSPKASPATKSKARYVKTASTKSPKQKPGTKKKPEASGKRNRHSDEDKSFARRAKPKTEDACNQWTALRDCYNKKLFQHFGASAQDKKIKLDSVWLSHVCLSNLQTVWCQMYTSMSESLQDPFWHHAKPQLPKNGTLDEYMELAMKAADEYLLKAPKE